MERHLDRSIQDVIAEFRGAMGTCLLREVIEVHGLSIDQEREAMRRIAAVMEIPPLTRKVAVPATGGARGPARFSPPVRTFVDEHVTIKRLLAVVPWIQGRLTGAGGRRERVTFERKTRCSILGEMFSRFEEPARLITMLETMEEQARTLSADG